MLILEFTVPFMTEIGSLKLLCRYLKGLVGSKVTSLVFSPDTPAAIVRSVVSAKASMNASLNTVYFTSCAELTNGLLNEIVATIEVKAFVLTRCDSITVKPLGAQVLFDKHCEHCDGEIIRNVPQIVTPGCWICYEPHECTTMDPESIVEIQLNALHYGRPMYDTFSREKFSLFCMGAGVQLLDFMERHGFDDIWFHEVVGQQTITDTRASVEAKVNLSTVVFFMEKPQKLWKVTGVHIHHELLN